MITEDDTYLTVEQASSRIKLAVNTLNAYRAKGNHQHLSPPFVKIGQRVLYPKAELDEWVMSHRQDPANAAA